MADGTGGNSGGSGFGWSEGFSAINLGMSVISGAMQASANREKARAQMSALASSWRWNKRVLQQNKLDAYASNLLESWGAGIKGTTGSTAAVIANNQAVLQSNIDYQQEQYDTQMKNLKAQSKEKYLGIF